MVDLKELGKVLRDGKIIKLDSSTPDSVELEKTLGQMLLCFGDIQYVE